MFLATKYSWHEFSLLCKLFTKKPHLFVEGSCIYATNKEMDGSDAKFLEHHYNNLF